MKFTITAPVLATLYITSNWRTQTSEMRIKRERERERERKRGERRGGGGGESEVGGRYTKRGKEGKWQRI